MNFVLQEKNKITMATIKVGNLTIHGYCMSSHGSILILEKYKIAFDCGIIPLNLLGKLCSCKMICITHGHADHISALHMDFLNRITKSAKMVEYVMPKVCVKPWLNIYSTFNTLNGRQRCSPPVRGIDEEEIKIDNKLSIFSHKTIHRVESFGYTLVEYREKLRDCFHGFPNKLLAKWRRHGVELTYRMRKPIFSYTGDTTIEGVLAHKDFLESDILVTECTFIDKDISVKEAKKRGHIHLSELVKNQHRIKGTLVLCHFSLRYTKEEIRKIVYEQNWVKKPILLL